MTDYDLKRNSKKEIKVDWKFKNNKNHYIMFHDCFSQNHEMFKTSLHYLFFPSLRQSHITVSEWVYELIKKLVILHILVSKFTHWFTMTACTNKK